MKVLIAAAVLAAFTAAQAQDKPAAAPPPSWQQGKPPAMAGSTLHPFAIHMTGKPAKEDRKSTRLNSSHIQKSRMPSSA